MYRVEKKTLYLFAHMVAVMRRFAKSPSKPPGEEERKRKMHRFQSLCCHCGFRYKRFFIFLQCSAALSLFPTSFDFRCKWWYFMSGRYEATASISSETSYMRAKREKGKQMAIKGAEGANRGSENTEKQTWVDNRRHRLRVYCGAVAEPLRVRGKRKNVFPKSNLRV